MLSETRGELLSPGQSELWSLVSPPERNLTCPSRTNLGVREVLTTRSKIVISNRQILHTQLSSEESDDDEDSFGSRKNVVEKDGVTKAKDAAVEKLQDATNMMSGLFSGFRK